MRIGFISTRVAGLDGVSLETFKWADIFQRMGHQVVYCAGDLEPHILQGWRIPLMHFLHPRILDLHHAFFRPNTWTTSHEREMKHLATELLFQLQAFVEHYRLDVLVLENVLAIPLHIPLAMAVTQLLRTSALPAIGHHHDFYWERERFRTPAVPEYLEQYFPPDLPNLVHVVINTVAQNDLKARRGMEAYLIPNIMDFDTAPRLSNPHVVRLRQDLGLTDEHLLFLQPTRVVPRKGIEHALTLLHYLHQPKFQNRLQGRQPILVISHPAGDEGTEYLQRLLQQAAKLNVPLIYAAHMLSGWPWQRAGRYTLWDAYAQADFVTYPSLYEGFGNAFLEAVYYRLPILVNRYRIYQTDLAPLGFQVAEMNGEMTPEVVEQVIELLMDPVRRRQAVEWNYYVAQKHFSYQRARDMFYDILSRWTNGNDVHSRSDPSGAMRI